MNLQLKTRKRELLKLKDSIGTTEKKYINCLHMNPGFVFEVFWLAEQLSSNNPKARKK